ncbi:unnamed protein product [Arctia plantaginis]|uniref:Uncharacterized protein n=1 Tax=Arctia plantaginis TaxID=874455 RepID=A0A8S1A2M0_ARCPL|nr:unnamed protein product [Arctia plantaginis]
MESRVVDEPNYTCRCRRCPARLYRLYRLHRLCRFAGAGACERAELWLGAPVAPQTTRTHAFASNNRTLIAFFPFGFVGKARELASARALLSTAIAFD